MRFRSVADETGQVFAVTGTNTVSFGLLAEEATRSGLLGFAVSRYDAASSTWRPLDGFKVFASIVPDPTPELRVSSFDHPVQSFFWDDFTATPGTVYEYAFQPVKGRPGALEYPGAPMTLSVRTEPLRGERHDVFFNRGVASSQAYVRRFGSTPIDELPPENRAQALDWLARDLDDALLDFVDGCETGDRLLGCFYEFDYEPAAAALRRAVDRGVDVRLVVDAKRNGSTHQDGTTDPDFPREENLAMLARVDLPLDRVVLREARASAISHNKFMVRVPAGRPATEVWTGSTNLSEGGVAGQTNVGHWVRDAGVAQAFRRYWELLATDPGGRRGDAPAAVRTANQAFRAAVVDLSPVPADLRDVAVGTTPAFSPRVDDTPARVVRAAAGRCRPAGVHHAGVRGRRRDQGRARGQHHPRPADLPAAGEARRARPAAPARVRAAEQPQQRLLRLGVAAAGPGLPVGRGARRPAAPAQLARGLHPLEVPAGRPARSRPGRGHRVGQLQRGVDGGERREHDRGAR